MSLRRVELPAGTAGELYLAAMPGRYEPWPQAQAEIQSHGVTYVVSLAPLEEVGQKSPDYARAIGEGRVPGIWRCWPIPDFGVPADRDGFLALARDLAGLLRSGRRALIHCGAGVGRTGTLAMAVLLALGLELQDAMARVHEAGSRPERPGQWDLVHWAAGELAG